MADRLILEYACSHEAELREWKFLFQPAGGGIVVEYTWGEVMDQARRMATYLQRQGLRAGARVGIISPNCAHFFMADLAIWLAGGTAVAIFPSVSPATMRQILEHSETSALFLGPIDDWAERAAALPVGLPCVTFPRTASAPGTGWEEITQATPPLAGVPARRPDDLALIAYTSGSTGQPKGVMHSFRGISRVTEEIVADADRELGPGFEHRVLSYLPLAHCFERAWIECAALFRGRQQVFFSESAATFMEDLRRAHPTTFISVPRLWLKFQQAVFARMPPEEVERALADPDRRDTTSRKILASLGLDAVRRAGTGSAPMSPELLQWYRSLGLELLEGYGMTEDFAYSHKCSLGANPPGHVGLPLPGVQARLDSTGEVLVKSPGRMVGYFKDPALTAACFTEDGFFHTGDLGEYNAEGLLRITGRVKELFKTTKGKYIAPAVIETLLNRSPLVELSMVAGAGQAQPYAMVVLAEHVRAQQRAELESGLEALRQQLNASLATHERLQTIVVMNIPWSVEGGTLTPTLKVRRASIEADAAPRVASWYRSGATVIWAGAAGDCS